MTVRLDTPVVKRRVSVYLHLCGEQLRNPYGGRGLIVCPACNLTVEGSGDFMEVSVPAGDILDSHELLVVERQDRNGAPANMREDMARELIERWTEMETA